MCITFCHVRMRNNIAHCDRSLRYAENMVHRKHDGEMLVRRGVRTTPASKAMA